ncbi:MAG: 50S ribosomal protein L32 [bacterium]|nr:50S ribosomal protein L32 [bacterium]
MAVPKRRTSKEKQRKRATFYKIKGVSPTTCPNCGEVRLPHRICPTCGYYKGKEIVKPREE